MVDTNIILIVLLSLIAFLVFIPGITLIYVLRHWQEDRERGFLERQDLQDRLMARSFTEYKDNVTPETNDIDVKEDEEKLDIDEAKNEITGEEDNDA